MGSYVLQKTTYRAAVRPDGQLLVFTFCNGHEKNVYPHTDRWSLACAGGIDATLRQIGATCAHLEDGLTQLGNDASPADWAQSQMDALNKPVGLIDLPESVVIREPDFRFWMASSQIFRDEDHARQSFANLLERWGKHVGATASPLAESDLLLALDGWSSRCHEAWPSNPGQWLTGHHLFVMDRPPPHSLRADHISRAFSIEKMPSIALWEDANGRWVIGGKLELLQHYWKEVFPALAHPLAQADWRASHQSLIDQITRQAALPAEAVMLRSPGDGAPHGDTAQWKRLFGEDAQKGSLATVAQHLGGHILGELLLRSCSVENVLIDDHEGLADSDATDHLAMAQQS